LPALASGVLPPPIPQRAPIPFPTKRQVSPAEHMRMAIGPVPQQSWSMPPQGWQLAGIPPPPPAQARPPWQAIPVRQQASPMAPQGLHEAGMPMAPAVQRRPALQAAPPPAQQTWLAAPQAMHMPPMPFIAPTQREPGWQLAPAQQAEPAAPQAMHMPGPVPGSLQPRPDWQVLPGQQRWPEPPQGWQVSGMPIAPVVQARPLWHELVPPPKPPPPAQQAWLAPPQATHMLLVQRAPGAVQKAPPKLPPQHCCMTAPQGMPMRWHDPFMHMPVVPPPMQAVPLARHWPPMQQPPLLQVLAAQQA
jgi:hypothetical protein